MAKKWKGDNEIVDRTIVSLVELALLNNNSVNRSRATRLKEVTESVAKCSRDECFGDMHIPEISDDRIIAAIVNAGDEKFLSVNEPVDGICLWLKHPKGDY